MVLHLVSLHRVLSVSPHCRYSKVVSIVYRAEQATVYIQLVVVQLNDASFPPAMIGMIGIPFTGKRDQVT